MGTKRLGISTGIAITMALEAPEKLKSVLLAAVSQSYCIQLYLWRVTDTALNIDSCLSFSFFKVPPETAEL